MDQRADIGIITGTGLYDIQMQDPRQIKIDTVFGTAEVTLGKVAGRTIAYIARHGSGHEKLPSDINHRANLMALSKLGVSSIILTSVSGVVNPTIELGCPLLIDDLFFIDNRLPSGEICTIFTEGGPGKGHYIFTKPYSAALKELAVEALKEKDIKYNVGVYCHVNGPRFNTRAEVAFLKSAGVSTISQTAGCETVLAGELGIPCLLLCFGVDYANGIGKTPKDELSANIARSKGVLSGLVKDIVAKVVPGQIGMDEGFLYKL